MVETPLPMGAYTHTKQYAMAFTAVRRPTDQSVPNATDTTVDFTASAAVEADTHAMFSTASPSQLSVKVPGVYALEGYVQWAANATGTRLLWLAVDGTRVAAVRTPVTDIGYYQVVTAMRELATGSVVTLGVRQNSGAALALVAGDGAPRLSAMWLRPAIS